MIIGGFQKFSLIDYPGKICAIIFTRGCNFRCRYCHNPELVIPEKYAPEIPLSEIYNFLENRRGKLDAVCITGGEPTLQPDLIKTMKKIKDMGFLVKLDTNGSYPEVLEEVINNRLADYLAMDVKAPLKDYAKIVNRYIPVEKLKKSIELIMNSGIKYEFRTTVVKPLVTENDLKEIAQEIRGAENYYLQNFIPTKPLDPSLTKKDSFSYEELEMLAKKLKKYVKNCYVR